jgi:UDP-GlcNAc:undecaprenyl-phosphate/decaprenyl-phosphate GlcNAc-1-phosphate transferase
MLSIPLLKYLIVFGLSIGIVILLTPLFIKLAPAFGLIDQPDERRIHKKPIPLGAGVVVFIGFHLTCYLLYHAIWLDFTGKLTLDWWQAFFISSTILLVVGLIDDRSGMSALTKLAGQAVATTCLYLLTDYQLGLLNFDFGFIGNLIFVLFWTLAIINAFNLIDGLDGLCSGLALISGIGLAVVFIFRGDSADALVCLALIGSCLGFLRYNFHPAQVFLGDTGSMFLGFALASISLHAGGKGSFFVFLASPFFVAGIPILDTLLAIWRRSMRKIAAKKNGNPSVKVMQADREHLHHRLLDAGLKQQHVAYTLYAANAAIVIIGLIYFMFSEISTGLFLLIFILSIYLLVKYVLHIELWETSKLMAHGESKVVIGKTGLMFYLLFDLLWMASMVGLSGFIAWHGESPFSSMGNWALSTPLWITPVFCLLFITHTYIKVWRNSFFRDYLWLALAIITGCLISLSLLLTLNSVDVFLTLNQVIVFCFLTALGVIGIRVPHHFLREWSLSAKDSSCKICQRNILIYGAGMHGGLYLRERQLKHAAELGGACVIGFIDDDIDLKNQYTFGLKVLGDLNDLKALVERFAIDEIVLSTVISADNLFLLQEIANEMNLKLFEWHAYTTQVNSTHAV